MEPSHPIYKNFALAHLRMDRSGTLPGGGEGGGGLMDMHRRQKCTLGALTSPCVTRLKNHKLCTKNTVTIFRF